jgi:lipid-binding SYLF domain-containing protein
MNRKILTSLALLAAFPVITGGAWDSMKDAAGKTGAAVIDGAGAVGNAAKDTVKSVTTKETAEETRAALNQTASKTLDRLFKERPSSRSLYNKAYGYAVFDTRKVSILITTGFGGGVAVEKASGRRTYMKMATGGVNLGVGGQVFQLVFLFENKASIDRFINQGWEAGAEANATMGKASAAATPRFVEGMAVYQLTEAGVMLALDFTGTKYWKSKELNEG